MSVRPSGDCILASAGSPAVGKFARALLIGSGALVGTLPGGHASAADLEVSQPPAVLNWSGPYIGVGVSTRHNSVDGSVTSATAGTTPIPLPPITAGGAAWEFWRSGGPSGTEYIDNIALRGGVYAGWNWQISPRYVVGVEADFSYANETGFLHGSPYMTNLVFGSPSPIPFGATPNDAFYVRTTWDSSARIRFGWLVYPSAMIYLTGGIAWAHLEAMSDCSARSTPNVSNCAIGNYFGGTLGPAVIKHSATKIGWTAGTGVDVMLNSRWIVRGQYRVSDFGYLSGAGAFNFSDTRVCSGCAASNNPLSVSYQLLMVQHNFELGLAYKF